jgi:hypothetical protein
MLNPNLSKLKNPVIKAMKGMTMYKAMTIILPAKNTTNPIRYNFCFVATVTTSEAIDKIVNIINKTGKSLNISLF